MLRDVIAAQILAFNRPRRSTYDDSAGVRLLACFAVIGLILQPGLRLLARASGLASERWIALAMVLVLVVAVVMGVRRVAGLGLESIGLYPWAAWTLRERIYLLTVGPLAAVAFSIVFRDHFALLARTHGWRELFLLIIPTGVLWGMAQELIYRGLLQTELVRRIGSVAGVLITNLVFTFGPLHFNYFGIGTDAGSRWEIFPAIFGIGLFFGILYRRSGNLWIPALLHGIWPPNMS